MWESVVIFFFKGTLDSFSHFYSFVECWIKPDNISVSTSVSFVVGIVFIKKSGIALL